MNVPDLIRLNNLPLVGKLVSQELNLGLHQSHRNGTGVEFAQYRDYRPGDDPKRIDWRRFAQTNNYLVRESEAESHQHVRLLLDQSGSMNYAENGVRRLDYARLVLASLAYVANRQGDTLSLSGLQQGVLVPLVPPGPQAFQKVLGTLAGLTASGPWPAGAVPTLPFGSQNKTELLILVSDLLQLSDEWLGFLRRAATPRREVWLVQVLGAQEVNFSLSGFYRFQDLETAQTVEVQAEAIREQVRANANAYFRHVAAQLQLPHLRRVQALLTDPPALVLRALLTNTAPLHSL